MKIQQKFRHVTGEFETDTVKMVCVPSRKHMEVDLCLADGMNYPIAEIKLYSEDLYSHAVTVFDDAAALGEEIAKRWNAGIPAKAGPQ